ncbi:MAG TPA: hypothetical protein VMV77_04750 [Bacteroidales bacterium]|nr:hypothetical protein [Bacteroidales bacterium]
MKTTEATRLYNEAEREIKKINSKRCFIDRAIDIVEYLNKVHGDETADEILGLVFENEIG